MINGSAERPGTFTARGGSRDAHLGKLIGVDVLLVEGKSSRPLVRHGATLMSSGISTVTWKNHSLEFSLELFPCFFGDGSVMAEAIKLEWQLF